MLFPIDFYYKCIILIMVLGLFESCSKYSNVVLNQEHFYKKHPVWWWREENCGIVAERRVRCTFSLLTKGHESRTDDTSDLDKLYWFFWFVQTRENWYLPSESLISTRLLTLSLSLSLSGRWSAASLQTPTLPEPEGYNFTSFHSHSTSSPLWMVQGSNFL